MLESRQQIAYAPRLKKVLAQWVGVTENMEEMDNMKMYGMESDECSIYARPDVLEQLHSLAETVAGHGYVAAVPNIYVTKEGIAGALVVAGSRRTFFAGMAMLRMVHGSFRASWSAWKDREPPAASLPFSASADSVAHHDVIAALDAARQSFSDSKLFARLFQFEAPGAGPAAVLFVSPVEPVYRGAMAILHMMCDKAVTEPQLYEHTIVISETDLYLKGATFGLELTEDEQQELDRFRERYTPSQSKNRMWAGYHAICRLGCLLGNSRDWVRNKLCL